MTVYVDRLFAVNLLLDYLLLLSTAQVMGLTLRRWRFGLAALLGASYAVAAVCLPVCGHPICKLLCGLAMAAVAFWKDRSFWRAAGLFGLLSGTLAGVLLALGQTDTGVFDFSRGWGTLLLSAGVFYLFLTLIYQQFLRHGRGELMDAVIHIWGKDCRLRVLRDTGNTLRNPVDGAPVLIAETAALRTLWPEEVARVLQSGLPPEECMAKLCRLGYTCFTLLPYQTVGRPCGLLLALRCDSITVGRGGWKRGLVALYDGAMGGAYHGLWGGEENADVLVAEAPAVDRVRQAG